MLVLAHEWICIVCLRLENATELNGRRLTVGHYDLAVMRQLMRSSLRVVLISVADPALQAGGLAAKRDSN